MIRETARLSEHFAKAPAIFTTSPLYRALCAAVAADQPILELLPARRAGQQPCYLCFAAVHELLLDGADRPLREFYPSIVGGDARGPEGAGPSGGRPA